MIDDVTPALSDVCTAASEALVPANIIVYWVANDDVTPAFRVTCTAASDADVPASMAPYNAFSDAVTPAFSDELVFETLEINEPVRFKNLESIVPESADNPDGPTLVHAVPPVVFTQTEPSCARMIDPDGSVIEPFGFVVATAEMVYSIEPVTIRIFSTLKSNGIIFSGYGPTEKLGAGIAKEAETTKSDVNESA